jgi:DNA-binding NtrC family response regulator
VVNLQGWWPMSADIRPLADVTEKHIRAALHVSHYHTGTAARWLGMSQRHLYNKIREYKIDLAFCRAQLKLNFPRKHF